MAGQTSVISQAAVMGNIFIFAFGGHETTANALINAIVLLAYRSDFQRNLQAELDEVLGDRPSSVWTYKTDFIKLLDGYTGALMNETLRLYSAVPFVPKMTKDQTSLKIEGRNYLIPTNTQCFIHTNATHQNPKYWPKANTDDHDAPYPVSAFDPSLWLKNGTGKVPDPGSYIPFSVGWRNCIGKRFAQTEFCSALATIFKEWSVELAIEGEGGETAEGYAAARRNAAQQLSVDGIGFELALKMMKDVPLRLMKRGQEKWTA